MKIAFGADHAGYQLKDHLVGLLSREGHEIEDLGPSTGDSVDYPDFAAAVAEKVAAGEVERGILVCGSGIGMAIAANKVGGVRAANCNGLFAARMSRAHNDVNILTLGERVVGIGLAEEIVRTFLDTRFEEGRHARRVDKIEALG